MRHLELRLLGRFAVIVDGDELPRSAWAQRRAADLVKVLALAPGRRLPRDVVLERIWPHLDVHAAAGALHKAAHYARRAVGDRDAVVLSGGVVALAPAGEVTTDVARFEAGDDSAYVGDLLPDDLHETWTIDERSRLRAIALDRARQAGDLQRVLALDPADEDATRGVMRAAARDGDRAAVVRAFLRLRDELAQLGMQPSPETVRLQRDLSRGPAVTAPLGEQAPMPGRASAREIALGTLDAADSGTGGLLLLRGEAGSGKTQLAEAALAEAADRRWHTVRASAHDDPDVLAAVAESLSAARPDLVAVAGAADPAALLARAADERGCAVLLDDLHVAPDAIGDALTKLAEHAGGRRLLVLAGWQPSEARARLQAAAEETVARRLATAIDLAPVDADLRPHTRYATTSDGARIAFQVVGDGPTDVVLVPGFVSNVEHVWDMPTARRMLHRIASRHRLIVWDKRGTGLSDPVADVPTLDERARDLTAVLDAAGAECPVLFGVSEGGPMALDFAARHPDRVAGLALYATAPFFMRDVDLPSGWIPDVAERLTARLFEHWGTGALLDMFAPSLADDPASREIFARFQRTGASPTMGRATILAMQEMDVRDRLADVRAPTLVLHRAGDHMVRPEGGRAIANGVAGAVYVELAGENHFPFLGNMDDVTDELEAFLSEASGPRRAPLAPEAPAHGSRPAGA